jgi:hypothetical protein
MMTNPCMACQHRAYLQAQDALQAKLQRHMRVIESLSRDIITATPQELPLVEAEVERTIGTLLRHAQVHPTPRHTGRMAP